MTFYLHSDEATTSAHAVAHLEPWCGSRDNGDRDLITLEVQDDDREAGLDRGPGIILFSTGMELLYMNRAAWEMSAQIDRALNGQATDGMTMRGVVRLSHEILKVLQAKGDPTDWARIHFRGLIGAPEYPVLLRGHGIPDPEGIERSRILICMDAVGPWSELTAVAQQRFSLTVRERNVVRHLVKGWTNKEIANALGITEQTVKEHIKHIMQKTCTTTRTGILACVLGLIPPMERTTDRSQVRAV